MRHVRIVVTLLCAGLALGIWSQPFSTNAQEGRYTTPAGNGLPIADPQQDPLGTLQDLTLLSQTTDPVSGPSTATGEFAANAPQFLSSGVHLQSAFARYSFVIPSTPNWTIGFTLGDDGQGDYHDLSIANTSGQLSAIEGLVQGNRYFPIRTNPVTDISGLDLTPGTAITLSIVIYRGWLVLAANDSYILDQLFPGFIVPGDIRAKVGWDAGDGSAASPVSMTISDFSVWAIPRDGIVWGLPPVPGASPQPTPVQTPGSFMPSTIQA